MQSFNQKTQIDLPNIRKKQTYKDKDSEDFNSLFVNDYKEADLIDLRKNKRFRNNHEHEFFKSHQFYLVFGFFMLVTACFLTVQVVINSPEIEKYKAVAKNIEDIDAENESKEPENSLIVQDEKPVVVQNDTSVKSNIPDVQFEGNPIKEPKQIATKRTVINKPVKQKTLKKTNHIVVRNLKKKNNVYKQLQIVKNKHLIQNMKKPESKIQEAIAEIMLRPLVISSEPVLKNINRN